MVSDEGLSSPVRTAAVGPTPSRTPPRPTARVVLPRRTQPPPVDVRLRISSFIGIAPLHVSFSVVLPGTLARGADFLWTDNGVPICNGSNGQKILVEPGEHQIGVLIITAAGQELRAAKTVKVLPRLNTR